MITVWWEFQSNHPAEWYFEVPREAAQLVAMLARTSADNAPAWGWHGDEPREVEQVILTMPHGALYVLDAREHHGPREYHPDAPPRGIERPAVKP